MILSCDSYNHDLQTPLGNRPLCFRTTVAGRGLFLQAATMKIKTGDKFGRWTVLKTGFSIGRTPKSVCRCKCGTVKQLANQNLKEGHTKSCGCVRFEKIKGLSRTPEYWVWKGMIARCHNPKCAQFKYYGARGISVCKRWRKFLNFLKDMGNRPSDKHSIERVKNNLGYSPKNCTWETMQSQCDNKRNNINITVNGETHSLGTWARINGIKYATIHGRWLRGWKPERIISCSHN